MKSLRIGLVSLSFSNFEAEKHNVLQKGKQELKGLLESSTINADLIAYPDFVEDRESAKKAVAFFHEKTVDFLLIQFGSFNLGDTILPFASVCKRIGFWIVPEPTYREELQLNSLTGFVMSNSIYHQFIKSRCPACRTKWFFGNPGYAAFDESLLITLHALEANININGSIIGQIGGVVPTFYNLDYDTRSLYSNLGVEIVEVSMGELIETYRSVQKGEVSTCVSEFRERASRIEVGDEWLEKSAKMATAIRLLKHRYGLDALALKCWPELQSELGIAPCAAVALLNDTETVTGCEGDLIGSISMYVGKIVTKTAVTMNDPVAVDIKSGTMQMWHCGPGPASWADEAGQCLDFHHTLNRRVEDKKHWTGVSSDISFRKGPVTVMRFGRNGQNLFCFEAEVVEGPAPPFPGSGGWFGCFTSQGNKVSVMDIIECIGRHGVEHHFPVAKGHLEGIYRELAAWEGLPVLSIHTWKAYLEGPNV